MKWYPGQNQDSPCTPGQLVSQNMFRQYLEDPSRNDFSFAREDDTCAATNTEVKVTETKCNKSCGCGTYTKTHTCVYKDGDQNGEAVPEDSDDFKCSCPANKGRVLKKMQFIFNPRIIKFLNVFYPTIIAVCGDQCQKMLNLVISMLVTEVDIES